jgi:hypothetical protein
MTTIIGVGLPVGDQVIEEEVRMGEALPFRLVAADAVQQVEDRVLLLGRVARGRVDLHLAGRAHRLRVVRDHLQIPVRHVLLGGDVGRRLGERGDVVGVQDDRLPLPRAGTAADRGGLLGEQERGELVQAAAPGQPLVRRAGRLVVDVLDPGLLQRLVIVLDALVHALRLGRADAQPEDLHLLVEVVGVGHDAAVGRLRVEGAAAESAARAAEAADVREQSRCLSVIWKVCMPPIESPAIAR